MRKPKYNIGDRVRCMRKTHTGTKTFIIEDINNWNDDAFDPTVYYYGGGDQHGNRETYVGCREQWLRKAQLKIRR